MEAFIIEAGVDTPEILMDPVNRKFEIAGKSLPEDVFTFYQPFFEWIDSFEANYNDEATFVFKYKYFNTASSKVILDILFKLDEINEAKNNIKIEWWFMEEDEDMQDAGEEYEDMLELEFSHKPYARGVQV